MGPVAGDVEGEGVLRRLAENHPFRQRFSDAAALQESSHDAAGEPVASLARDRADERVAVRREGEGAVDPFADSGGLKDGIAAVDELELARDAVDVFLQKLHAVVPRRALHGPVLRVGLIDAYQHALLVLAHIGIALEVDDHRHFGLQRCDLGNRLGDKVVVFERRDRQLESHHAAHLLGP